MENTQAKEVLQSESCLSEDIKISGALVQTAQETLSDLDRSIMELAVLVDGLRDQSKKLKIKAI